MDPRTAPWWKKQNRIGRFPGGPVHPEDISIPCISRLDHDQVLASVTTRTHADRWAALTLRLQPRRGRWRVTDLQRLLAPAHYRSGPEMSPPATVSLEARLQTLREAQRLAHAAARAAHQRLADVAPTDPGRQAAIQLLASWQVAGAHLDRQVGELRLRLTTRQAFHQLRRR